MKKGFTTIGLMIAMGIIGPFAATQFVHITAQDQIYQAIEEIPQMDAALVFGAAAYPNGLSDILEDRMDTAIELYEADKVERLIVTGAENESSAMAAYALENGVPSEDIVEDPAGIKTMASLENAESAQSLILVTQEYHLPRAIFAAERLDFEVVGMAADRGDYVDLDRFKRREFLAINKMMWDLYVVE